MRAGSAIALLAMTTAAGVAGFPASALAKPTSPHSTTHLTTASTAVANIHVAPGITTADVSWDAFALADNYVVTINGSPGCATATLTCNVTGLVAGTTYTATVEALTGVTSIGTGTSTTFKVGRPAAPPKPTVNVMDDGTVAVSWGGGGDPGAGILTYTATTSTGGFTCTTADADTTSCTIPDAGPTPTPGTSFTVSVKAHGKVNSVDLTNDSVASVASDAFVVPLNAPTGVNVTGTTAAGHLTVNWTVPTDTRGVDHYTATLMPGNVQCSSTPLADPTQHSCPITTGLMPGVSYSVQVVSIGATDDVMSPPSLPSLPVVFGPLYVPTGVTATAGDSIATVSWTAPTGFPAGSVAYYTVTSSDGDVCNTPDATVTRCTVTGLANFRSATFTVVANVDPTVTGLTHSPDSLASAPVTPLPAAINLKASANGKYVTAENAGMAPLIANRAAANAYEKFWVTQNADGSVSLKSAANGKYVTADPSGAPLIANRSAIGTWEEFALVDDGSGVFTLRAMSNGKYVSADHAGATSLVANRTVIGSWEMFTLTAAS